MVSRELELHISTPAGKYRYNLTLKDQEPFARPATYLSSHTLLTALIFHSLYTASSVRSRDNIYSTGELIFAVLHHDDGKNTQEWQEWLANSSRKSDWTRYREHADSSLFNRDLHSEEELFLKANGIPLEENEKLAKWVMGNHHPHKQMDGLSLRVERLLIVFSDHISAKIESNISATNQILDLPAIVRGEDSDKGKWLYGALSLYYHPELEEVLKTVKMKVSTKPAMEEGVF